MGGLLNDYISKGYSIADFENELKKLIEKYKKIIKFIEKTKEGSYSGKEELSEEYIIQYDIPPQDVQEIVEDTCEEYYYFGLSD